MQVEWVKPSTNKDADTESKKLIEAYWVRVTALPCDLLCQGSWNCFISFFPMNICFESRATKPPHACLTFLFRHTLVLSLKNCAFSSKMYWYEFLICREKKVFAFFGWLGVVIINNKKKCNNRSLIFSAYGTDDLCYLFSFILRASQWGGLFNYVHLLSKLGTRALDSLCYMADK